MMVRSTRASWCPDLPDDRPMTVKQVARLCGSVRALSADMELLARVTDTGPMRKVIEPTRMNHETL